MHRSILKQFAEYLHILQHFSIQPATLPTYTVLLEGRPVNHKPAGYLPGQGHGIGTPLAAIPPSVSCEGKLPHLWTTIRQTGYLVREGLLFGHNPPIFSVPEGPPTDRNHLRSVKGSAAVDFSDMHPPGEPVQIGKPQSPNSYRPPHAKTQTALRKPQPSGVPPNRAKRADAHIASDRLPIARSG